jgi:dodecin
MSSVARVSEITASSTISFQDAIEIGIARAARTLTNVEGAWVQDQKIIIENGAIAAYRVNLKVTFVLND